ncbi:ubiquitin-like modifier-activating enzyme ATG7 [Oppia nitens]|uniref:ubiquitin-like modifier-activating enzyme ATG7 n=1 Tax=Oppia nitens TaxID=1686743 RepID=UPI0023DB0DA7|nr:ubiquitin-like modifier-activating enzyme ATG7 [Oppia nitens]
MSLSTSTEPQLLKYYPFSSVIDQGFWHLLANKKLDTIHLDDNAIDIVATFRCDLSPNLPPLLNVDYNSFDTCDSSCDQTKETHYMSGQLIVTNTLEEFINKDKKLLINDLAKQIWSDIIDDTEDENISKVLSKFLLLVYADLKKYKFHYWFAFPAICFPMKTLTNGLPNVLANVWTDDYINALYLQINNNLEIKNKSYFIVILTDSGPTVHSITEYSEFKDKSNVKIFFAFADSSSSQQYPGWPLRNYLTFISIRYKLNKCCVLALRLRENSVKSSLLLDIEWQQSNQVPDIETIECVGWEKNENNKLLPRIVDLSAIMDPIRLADNAVDLNLKLMRWRLVPSLDLDTITKTKCLLLGSGTLGCSVGRTLLAWGIKNITFVDNSQVSYSNPVRQSLFTFSDCLNGGQPKAKAAAEALKTIFPNVNSKGISLSIPMPGHPVSSQLKDKVCQDVKQLEELIDENDVIFLLMDTRESRWLPTVLSAVKNKLVINAALGFDTFLVQRHGVRSSSDISRVSDEPLIGAIGGQPSTSTTSAHRSRKVNGTELGCYYCSDVVAPTNSTRDRTLDQQCTVTRPGVAMLASALAVELMVSVLEHPMRGYAPSLVINGDYCDDVDTDTETALGLVPHQIRGFLSRFQQMMITSERFTKCSACSQPIINAYNEMGFEFLLNAFNDSNYIEEITGLTQLHNETNLEDIWCLSDDDED